MSMNKSVEFSKSTELTRLWKNDLKGILLTIRCPQNFHEAVTLIENSLMWQKLYSDWDNLPGRQRVHRWKAFLDEIVSLAYKTRPFCIQCGDCCKQGSPTLHKKDRQLLDKGVLKTSHLITLRKGEMAYSAIERRVVFLKEEMIKLKEKPGSRECIFLNHDNKCSTYQNRPLQCITLECWNPGKLEALYKRNPKLNRHDIVAKSKMLYEIIEAHEQRCSYESLKAAFKGLEKHQDEIEVLELLAYDTECRPFFMENLGLVSEEMDFYFGRPFSLTIQKMFGYRVEEESPSSFVLVSPGFS